MDWKLGGVVLAFILPSTGIAQDLATVTIPGVSVQQMRDEVAAACVTNGGQLKSEEYAISCGKRDDSGRAMLMQAMLGNRHSQTPWQYVRFSIVPVSDGVLLGASAYTEMTMGYGDTKRIQHDGAKWTAAIQSQLDQVKARAAKPSPNAPAPDSQALPPQPPGASCQSCKSIGRGW